MTSPPHTWDVFVSYARADQDTVRQLAGNLHNVGLDIFLDEWEIGDGDVLVHRIDKGLREYRHGVRVVSPASMSRPWVMQEDAVMLEAALHRNLRLVPVLIETATLPPMLGTRKWVDLRGKAGNAYLAEVRRLADALQGKRPSPPPRTGALKAP